MASGRKAPDTISAEAQAFIRSAPPEVDRYFEPERMDALRAETREAFAPASEQVRDAVVERIDADVIGDVQVEVVTPRDVRPDPDEKALLYLHGGGYVVGSPFEGLTLSGPIAHRLGVRAWAPRYRLAPEHAYPAAVDDAMTVYRALVEQVGAENLAVFGDSAGGNLTLATVLRARDEGLPLPAAVGLLSPWADIGDAGDAGIVVEGHDPTLGAGSDLDGAARSYAGALALDDPRVSPLYADYTEGFPPAIITTGTRDYLLSSCVRLHREMRRSGTDVTLHVWEGMWHVFEFYPDIPEGADSLAEIATFLGRHLDR